MTCPVSLSGNILQIYNRLSPRGHCVSCMVSKPFLYFEYFNLSQILPQPGRGDTLFRPAASPSPVFPGQFDRLHKNTGNNREKREAMKGKRLFFRRIRQINPTGGIGQNPVFQNILSPRGGAKKTQRQFEGIEL